MNINGFFVNYQMAEALELISSFDLNTPEGKTNAEAELAKLKISWLSDILPGTSIKIGDKMAGMQDLTIDDVTQLSVLLKQPETYTVENAGAFQYILNLDEKGQFDFNFEKLDTIARLARKNNKKIIIDSAVVFGDVFPFKIANLDKDTITKLIAEYTHKITERYGDIIERMDVLNAIFKRQQVSKDNSSEVFWINKFGENYAQEIINIIKNNIDTKLNVKLCWNEFYLTHSKYEQRKTEFLNKIKLLSGLDVVGIQDRFMSGEDIEYILKSLDEIIEASKNGNKEVCITEFSCSASSVDLQNGDIENINSKIKHIISSIQDYAKKNNTIKRIESHVSDKFDFNYKELKEYGFDISTTGRKTILEEKDAVTIEEEKPFDERSQIEAQLYQQIKTKNQLIKQQKEIKKQNEKQKVLVLTESSSNGQADNKGFGNTVILLLVISFVCGALFMVVYMFLGR